MKIESSEYSIEQGDCISFFLENFDLNDRTYAQPYISLVNSDYDDLKIICSCKIENIDGRYVFEFTHTCGLEAGLYVISLIRFTYSEKNESGNSENIIDEGSFFASSEEYGTIFFEIREKNVPAKKDTDLLEEYRNILKNRDEDFYKGFGNISCSGEKQIYTAVVLVKNCLLTSRMRVGQYELIPVGGLGCMDTIQLMNQCLAHTTIQPLFNIDEVVEIAKSGQPSFVVFFPKVMAASLEEAFQLVELEVNILCNVMALHRSSYANIISSALMHMESSECYHKVYTPSYRGNKCEVSVPEEYRMIRNRMIKARSDERLQLYAALYKECLLESRREFAYFRFWNLLETISRRKDFVGMPLRDAKGNIRKNRKGHPRKIQDCAEELVFEYLRANKILNIPMDRELLYPSTEEQIPIWYRNRNCVVHGGGCFSDNSTFCNQCDAKYRNCKSAYNETLSKHGMVEIGIDPYLKTLRDVVMFAVCNEFLES